MSDDWKSGFEAGFAAGYAAAQEQTPKREEVRVADADLQARFGVITGTLVRVYRNERGDIVGAVSA